MLNQDPQQFVFFGRKLDLSGCPPSRAGGQDLPKRSPIWEDRPLALGLQLMTQRRAHSREEFVHAERLCDVIVGTKIQSLHLASLVAPAGQNDDRDPIVAGSDSAQQVVAEHIGQAEVEDY